MSKLVIDVDKALNGIWKAVTEMGESYVYEPPVEGTGCVYTAPNGTGSCIVGKVFVKLGLKMTLGNGGKIEGGINSAIDKFRRENPDVVITSGAHIVLATAQRLQDSRHPWGIAAAGASAAAGALYAQGIE